MIAAGVSPRPGPSRRDAGRLLAASAAALLALCALAGLVAAGRLSSVDTYAVRHLMPFSSVVGSGSPRSLGTLLGYEGVRFRFGDLMRSVAGPAPSFLLTAGLSLVLWRRGRRTLAALCVGAIAAANLGEAFGRVVIAKPQLYGVYRGSLTPVGFHHSFPSGHAARSAVLAATAVCVWRRVWPAFVGWVALVVVTSELDGEHTPSDLAGGLLLAACLILAVAAIERWWGPELDRKLGRQPSWR
jgi:membrane-associated phospholipid phosphatase